MFALAWVLSLCRTFGAADNLAKEGERKKEGNERQRQRDRTDRTERRKRNYPGATHFFSLILRGFAIIMIFSSSTRADSIIRSSLCVPIDAGSVGGSLLFLFDKKEGCT